MRVPMWHLLPTEERRVCESHRYVRGDPSALPSNRCMKNAASLLTFATLLFVAPGVTNAQDGGQADNTKVNKRDRSSSAVTADQQKENEGDRELSANIRKALMDNKDLSTYAHNVKIVSRNGMVTL